DEAEQRAMADLAGVDLVDPPLIVEDDLENVTGRHLARRACMLGSGHITRDTPERQPRGESGPRTVTTDTAMAIKLRVISDQYRDLGDQRTRVFGVNGGTIGRAPDNDWILPDAKRIV